MTEKLMSPRTIRALTDFTNAVDSEWLTLHSNIKFCKNSRSLIITIDNINAEEFKMLTNAMKD